MKSVMCPHCKTHRIVTAEIPRDVVIVLSCPGCHEWVILSRNKAIPLSRRILERGTLREKKLHLATVIAEFLEPGLFSFGRKRPRPAHDAPDFEEDGLAPDDNEVDGEADAPITDQEVEQFLQVELKLIDNPAYFKKHFGCEDS